MRIFYLRKKKLKNQVGRCKTGAGQDKIKKRSFNTII